MIHKPIISFITVNYNGLQDTIELIESVLQIVHSVSYEIIAVDNASDGQEANKLRKRFNTITVIENQQNEGFAGGNNKGILQAKGKYLFFINNDTYICEDHFYEMIQKMEQFPRIGGLSPKILFTETPQHIQYAGFTPLSPLTLRNKTIGYDQPDNGQFDTPHPTPFLHGAAMLIKREVIKKVGFMPEVFFLYYEEMDWCTRIRKAGYELWYDPIQTVYHKESRSTGKLSKTHIFYLYRNRLLYAWRNLHSINRILSIIYLSTVAAIKNSVYYCLKGHFLPAFTIYRAVLAFIFLPHKMK